MSKNRARFCWEKVLQFSAYCLGGTNSGAKQESRISQGYMATEFDILPEGVEDKNGNLLM